MSDTTHRGNSRDTRDIEQAGGRQAGRPGREDAR